MSNALCMFRANRSELSFAFEGRKATKKSQKLEPHHAARKMWNICFIFELIYYFLTNDYEITMFPQR